MNRDKLIKTLLEHEENLDIDDLKNLNDYYLHDFDFLTRVDSELQELDWERGGVLSKCFKEKEVLHIRNEFFMGGNSLRGLHYKTIRVINYRGEIPGFLVTNNDESLDIRASEVDLDLTNFNFTGSFRISFVGEGGSNNKVKVKLNSGTRFVVDALDIGEGNELTIEGGRIDEHLSKIGEKLKYEWRG